MFGGKKTRGPIKMGFEEGGGVENINEIITASQDIRSTSLLSKTHIKGRFYIFYVQKV